MSMNARLWPVCPASFTHLTAYANSVGKDADHRAPCPVCLKVVKLRKVGIDRYRETIPYHHAQPNEANLARARAIRDEALKEKA